jgi:hypothetical protein
VNGVIRYNSSSHNVTSDVSPVTTTPKERYSPLNYLILTGTNMAKQTPTPGRCMICKEVVTKRTILNHILKNHTSESGMKRFFIMVDTPSPSPYWLALLADPDAELKKLDSLLRSVWLECCGHLSLFTIQGAEYMTTWDEAGCDKDLPDTENMYDKMKELLRPGMKFSHEYDFGTPTELRLKIADLLLVDSSSPVDVVGMNTKPVMICDDCGKPAEFHYVEWGEEKNLCRSCSENEEEYDERMFHPICNSPRTGVCGYEGGRYDEDPEDE